MPFIGYLIIDKNETRALKTNLRFEHGSRLPAQGFDTLEDFKKAAEQAAPTSMASDYIIRKI